MKIDFATPYVAAFALWSRDRAVLMPVAGLFLFVPTFARLLLVPEMPAPVTGEATPEAMIEWTRAFTAWASAYGAWYIVPPLLALFATLVATALYVANGRPTLGSALAKALGLLPRFVLATILVSLPVGGLLLMALPFPILVYFLILPVFYVFARTMLIAPVLVAEGPVGAVGAIARSWRLTAGNGIPLTFVYSAAALAGPLAGSALLGLEKVGGPNPVLIAFTSAAAALCATAAALALVLAQVAIYGRLASKGI